MALLDVNLCEQPLDVEEFSYLSDTDYPLCMLGFQIKNLYDQKRLVINKSFNPISVIHFVPNEPLEPKFFKGIRIAFKNKYLPLLKQLDALGTDHSIKLTKNFYDNLLTKYNLKCDDCYAFLNRGIYPINGEYLNNLTDSKINMDDLYSKVLNTESGFQSYGYFSIYVLSNKNIQNTTTKKFIKSALTNYSND